jgi:hypothetical protein
MFRDTKSRRWPAEANHINANTIIANAIVNYIGGKALNSELSPDNPETWRTLDDLDDLIKVLWKRSRKNDDWYDLTSVLQQEIDGLSKRLKEMTDAKYKNKRKKEVFTR